MSRVGQLLVKCPGCAALYQSGIITDLDMVERDLSGEHTVMTRCPFCGRQNSTALEAMAFVATSP